MIELRPRKLARLLSGSDRREGDASEEGPESCAQVLRSGPGAESCPQVLKRGPGAKSCAQVLRRGPGAESCPQVLKRGPGAKSCLQVLRSGPGAESCPQVLKRGPGAKFCPQVLKRGPGAESCAQILGGGPGAKSCPQEQKRGPGAESCAQVLGGGPGAKSCPQVQKRGPGAESCPQVQKRGLGAESCPRVLGGEPGAESCPQVLGGVDSKGTLVKKRGRTPKISAPVGSGEPQIGADEASSKEKLQVRNVCGPVKKRGRKPKLNRIFCAQPPCASEVSHQPKKRVRKAKAGQSECESPTSGQDQGCGTELKKSHGRISNVRRTEAAGDQQAGSAQDSAAPGQGKRKRKLKIQPSVKCEDLETAETSCVNSAGTDSRSSKQEQGFVCSSGGGQPERKKKGRKTVKEVKNEPPCEEMKRFSGAGKSRIHTVQVRVMRSIPSHVSKKALVSSEHVKNLHAEERKSSAEQTEPRNSRRTKPVNPISNVENRKVPGPSKLNRNCLMTASKQSSVLKAEEKAVKSLMSKNHVTKCSTKSCHVHSPDLPNPVVRLQNCKSFHQHSKKLPIRLGSMLTALNMQKQISLLDNAVSDNASVSAIKDVNHNEQAVESTSVVNNQNHKRTFLKVKFNFRKREQKNDSHTEESDTESSDCRTKEQKHEDQQHMGVCIAKPESSGSHSETLMDKLNNNTTVSAGMKSSNEQLKDVTSPVCRSWHSWRTPTPFASDEEVSDHDFDKCPSITVTCQRVIPFTGKTIRKCSCARTYVSVVSRKRPADVRKTFILGTEAERSQEVYTNDKHESIVGESILERIKESDGKAVCKKRKLDVHVENTLSHNFASGDTTLNETHSSENERVRMAQLRTSETSDASPSLPLASEPSRKDMGTQCSAQDEAQNDEHNFQQLQRDDTTHVLSKSPSKTLTEIDQKTIMEIDQKTVSDPVVFKIPNDETITLLHGGVPFVSSISRDLNEACYTSIPLEEVDASFLNKNVKSSHHRPDSEGGQSNCCPSEWFADEDSVKRDDTCDNAATLAPAITKRSANSCTIDLLKAYDEDVLVLDVIQDDPELFGSSVEKERSSTKKCFKTNNVTSSKPIKMALISKAQKRAVSPAYESKTCIKRIEYVPETTTESLNDLFDAGSDYQDTCKSFPDTDEITIPAEMEESRSSSGSQDMVPDTVQDFHHASMLDESKSSSPFREVLPGNHLPWPQKPFFHHPKSESPIMNNTPPWMHDLHSNWKDIPPPVASLDSMEKWKHENVIPRIQFTRIPPGYCRYFFNTFKGCTVRQCLYLHIPKMCDEKVCMNVLRKLINESSPFLLKRAVWIFRSYYSQYPPRLHYDGSVFGALLIPLLKLSLWQDLFCLLETAATAKIFPALEQIIKVFESVTFSGLQPACSALLDIFSKFVHNGMKVTPADISHIIAIMSKSNTAKNHINILLSMKSSLEMKIPKTNWAYDMGVAMAEVEHCKVNSDWMKLGTLYLTVCTGCENLTNLKNFSRSIAEALMKDSGSERPEIPYCEFADIIFKNPQFSDIQKNILGRIGLSVMFFYHREELWQKGRKVIHKFRELKINYTILKGLFGQESSVSRCHVVNIAVEIFLKCGNLGNAVQTLKDCDWIINTSMWPCNMMDVLHRHNVMCLLVHEALSKSMYPMCFDVLQNLPGFQESQADLNVSQYTMLFNKVLSACVANRSLGISSSIVEFMVAKKIAIDYVNLQGLITNLGRSGQWTKARGYYKSALALGFYPLEGKMNPNILYIPSFMSEVEMLMTIEHFMVSNASSLQLQGGCNQSLQIVLKRMEEDSAKCKDRYHAAADRLFEAGRLSTPKLFIKHMTVNNTNEQVYTLDNNSSLKWLNENMKWAGNVWHHHYCQSLSTHSTV